MTSQELIVKSYVWDIYIYRRFYIWSNLQNIIHQTVAADSMLTCQLYQADYQAVAWFSELTTDLRPDLVRATHAWTLVDMCGIWVMWVGIIWRLDWTRFKEFTLHLKHLLLLCSKLSFSNSKWNLFRMDIIDYQIPTTFLLCLVSYNSK